MLQRLVRRPARTDTVVELAGIVSDHDAAAVRRWHQRAGQPGDVGADRARMSTR
jgi:hypothetical protein